MYIYHRLTIYSLIFSGGISCFILVCLDDGSREPVQHGQEMVVTEEGEGSGGEESSRTCGNIQKIQIEVVLS